MTANSLPQKEQKQRKSSKRVELPLLTEEEIFGASAMQSNSGYNQIGFLVNRPASVTPVDRKTEAAEDKELVSPVGVETGSSAPTMVPQSMTTEGSVVVTSVVVEHHTVGITELIESTTTDHADTKPTDHLEKATTVDVESNPLPHSLYPLYATTTSPVDTTTLSTAVSYERSYKFQPRPLKNAHDGHTPSERALFDQLWNLAPAISGENRFRHIGIGYGDLARLFKVDKKQVRRWLSSLQAKLSLEVEVEGGVVSKTVYKVFSEEAIVRRREAAGYIAFVKNRGGVILLRADGVDNESVSTAKRLI